jgi:hypothetical protein
MHLFAPTQLHGQHRRSAATPSPGNIVIDGDDIAQVTAAIVAAWGEIDTALSPIIGQRGVAALYERSLYLARVQHPWLVAVPEGLEARMDLPALQAVLAKQTSASAAAGGEAHLKALHQLLRGLVGDSLAARLLASTPLNALIGPAAKKDPSND